MPETRGNANGLPEPKREIADRNSTSCRVTENTDRPSTTLDIKENARKLPASGGQQPCFDSCQGLTSGIDSGARCEWISS